MYNIPAVLWKVYGKCGENILYAQKWTHKLIYECKRKHFLWFSAMVKLSPEQQQQQQQQEKMN